MILKHAALSSRSGERRGSSRSHLDVKGYIPIKKQVMRLLGAGRDLEEYRRRVYQGYQSGDYDGDLNYEGEPSPLLDPDRLPSVDNARIISSLQERANKLKESEKQLSTSFSGSASGANEKKQSEPEPEKTGASGVSVDSNGMSGQTG